MPTPTQIYPYNSRRWVRAVVDEHHRAGGHEIESPESLLEVMTQAIRRAEPDLINMLVHGACPRCSYPYGWRRRGSYIRVATCWSCRTATDATRWPLSTKQAA